jgi:DNA-binding MarR family transcriptional regulator
VATTERPADLVFLLSQAAHALQTEMTAELADLGVTPRMHCVLYHAQGGEFTQIQLADKCALDKTTMVVTMDALEKAGLAERRPSPTDRRARIIAVTEAGAELVARGDAIVARLYADVLESLPEDSRDAFVGGLQSLVTGRLANPPACEQPVRRRRTG